MTTTTTPPVPSELLRAHAVAAALAVGPDLLAAFRTRMEVGHKRDHRDQVTEHDRLAEQKISRLLLTACPDSAVVGEEFGQCGDADLLWYVDPIDGTSAFIQGLAFFSVSIAAVFRGTVIAGVVYDPVAAELFSADDAGAYLNEQRLPQLAEGKENDANLITGFPSARDLAQARAPYLEDFATLVEKHQSVRRISSAALSLAYVAAGRADAVFGSGVNTWDIAAGALLVQRVGGTYRGLGLSQELDEPTAAHISGPLYLAHRAGHYLTLYRLAEHVRSIRLDTTTIKEEPNHGIN